MPKPGKSYHCSFCGRNTPRARPLYRAGAICYRCLNAQHSPCLLCYDEIKQDEYAVMVDDLIPFEPKIKEFVQREDDVPILRVDKGGEQYLLLAQRPYHGSGVRTMSANNYVCGCCGMPIELDRNSPDAVGEAPNTQATNTMRLMHIYGRPICLDCQRSGYWQFQSYFRGLPGARNHFFINPVLKRSVFYRIITPKDFPDPSEKIKEMFVQSDAIIHHPLGDFTKFEDIKATAAGNATPGNSRHKCVLLRLLQRLFRTTDDSKELDEPIPAVSDPVVAADQEQIEQVVLPDASPGSMSSRFEPASTKASSGVPVPHFLPSSLDDVWRTLRFVTQIKESKERKDVDSGFDPTGDSLFKIPFNFVRVFRDRLELESRVDTPGRLQCEHAVIATWSYLFYLTHKIEIQEPIVFRYEKEWFNEEFFSKVLLLRASVVNEAIVFIKSIFGNAEALERFISDSHPILARAMRSLPNFFGSSARCSAADLLLADKLDGQVNVFMEHAIREIDLWKVEDNLLLHARVIETNGKHSTGGRE